MLTSKTTSVGCSQTNNSQAYFLDGAKQHRIENAWSLKNKRPAITMERIAKWCNSSDVGLIASWSLRHYPSYGNTPAVVFSENVVTQRTPNLKFKDSEPAMASQARSEIDFERFWERLACNWKARASVKRNNKSCWLSIFLNNSKKILASCKQT